MCVAVWATTLEPVDWMSSNFYRKTPVDYMNMLAESHMPHTPYYVGVKQNPSEKMEIQNKGLRV